MVDDELRREVPPAVVTLAERLAARAQGGAAAVLFYGSALRDCTLDGVLDFYVLVDHVTDWPGSLLAACANRLLPPNVGYLEESVDGQSLKAKYAVMTVAQFRRAMSLQCLDTTLWARFSQPCACIYTRSEADQLAMRDAVCDAVVAAAHWAAILGPLHAEPIAYWRALYARTYAAELRVERGTRSADLLAHNGPRYARLLPLAWEEGGLAFTTAVDELAPVLAPDERTIAERRWRMRQRLGPILNVLRLLKAALTFDNATDYVAWKVERHSGYKIEPTPFQRRHPLLAAPGIYWRLRRRGVLR
ncbi:hypothetical protein PY257_01340 [Ramlibacter sp. H39-3-26]|uniref:hypothetical protein n=1 Tax=Curvibacter soli TaxID=3031331 RepID=UPI0023DB73FC|nr:hypothetical protein [Ramlibacter sp. H39-3-26]MDF1483842.1 hypothetical protein [Ramlibacter sp. H39-3-26]